MIDHFIHNKTSLQPVSRPVEQVPLFWGVRGGYKVLWGQCCAERQTGRMVTLAPLEAHLVSVIILHKMFN